MHVLIIEDEALVALHIQTLLEELGADSTDIAATQEEAVDCAKAHRPDLITSDVRLLKGDGPSAVREIKSALGEVPVIYVTASSETAREADPDATVLAKPVCWLDLVNATSAYGLPPTIN